MTRTKWVVLALGLAFVTFLTGNVSGFFIGVYSTRAGAAFIHDLFEEERAAEVASPRTHSRTAFTLKYPANWQIDVEDEDYDPDHQFSIDSPGDASITFTIYDGETDPSENVEGQVETITSKLVRNATRTDFTEWGSFKGKGAVLKGTYFGFLPGTVRIFSCQIGSRSFFMLEQRADEDAAMVDPGFKLIESSMTFNER